MFLVDNERIARDILFFYDHPNHADLRDMLSGLGLLRRVESYVNEVRRLSLANFIQNNSWTGISPAMDQYLPSVIYDAGDNFAVRRSSDVLRTISSSQPLQNVHLSANDRTWFRAQDVGSSMSIDPGLPVCVLPYEVIKVVSDSHTDNVQYTSTFLPTDIRRDLGNFSNIKPVKIPYQNSTCNIQKGAMAI